MISEMTAPGLWPELLVPLAMSPMFPTSQYRQRPWILNDGVSLSFEQELLQHFGNICCLVAFRQHVSYCFGNVIV